MRVERAGARARAEVPDVAEQLLLREHPPRVGGEPEQQVVLLLRERERLSADGDQRAFWRRSRAGRRRARRAASRSPEHRVDARDQLVVVERPRHVVVATTTERPHAVDRIGLGAAEHDHGRLAAPALERRLVAGEHDVRPRLRRGDELEPVAGQPLLEEPARGGLAVGEEHGGRHGFDGTAAPAHRIDVLCGDFATILPQPSGTAMALGTGLRSADGRLRTRSSPDRDPFRAVGPKYVRHVFHGNGEDARQHPDAARGTRPGQAVLAMTSRTDRAGSDERGRHDEQ